MEEKMIDRIIELCKEKKKNGEVGIYTNISSIIYKQYGVSVDSEKIRNVSRRYREKNNLDEYFNPKGFSSEEIKIHQDLEDKDCTPPYKESIEIHSDGKQTSDKLIKMSETQSKDVDYILLAHGYDPQVWECISARNNIWNVYSKLDGIQVLYSSKIVVKPRTEYKWVAEDIIKLFEILNKKKPIAKNIKPLQYDENGSTLLLPIADFHYNLNSKKFATGNTYNTDIAKELFFSTITDIKNRVSNRKFKKVVFVVGNDFINADNIGGTTTKLTPQDNVSDWFQVVVDATSLLVEGIDILAKIAPVEVLYVPSNHDLHTMFGIMQSLYHHYRLEDNITIDTSPMPRKYYSFGKNLLCLSHDLKTKEALKIITAEAKSVWSDCEHVYCMLAHLHTAMVYEKEGMLEVMRLPTISGWSRWTNQMGYVQTDRKNKAFIFDDKLGITDELNTIFLLED